MARSQLKAYYQYQNKFQKLQKGNKIHDRAECCISTFYIDVLPSAITPVLKGKTIANLVIVAPWFIRLYMEIIFEI